jgi:drug/metabolite transporter (DMT)-like permease
MTSPQRGIALMVGSVALFAIQDGFSRYLAETYNTLMVVMIRYWVFSAFVLIWAARRPEGFRAAISSARLPAHILRAVLLVAETCIIVWGFTLIGLIESHAVFAICPLFVVALSGPVLGEVVSWKRWTAVAIGFVGVLIILRPGAAVFSWTALIPLAAAILFATYAVLTRLTTRGEANFPAFFWPAVAGGLVMTLIGLPHLQPINAADIPYFAAYAGVAILSNWTLQKTYQTVEAATVQPFAYLQFVFASMIGLLIFGETLASQVVLGVAVVILAGFYALTLDRKKAPQTR